MYMYQCFLAPLAYIWCTSLECQMIRLLFVLFSIKKCSIYLHSLPGTGPGISSARPGTHILWTLSYRPPTGHFSTAHIALEEQRNDFSKLSLNLAIFCYFLYNHSDILVMNYVLPFWLRPSGSIEILLAKKLNRVKMTDIALGHDKQEIPVMCELV